MQSQYTPQFLAKTFKRHYHKGKDVAKKLAAGDSSFSFSFSFNKDKGLQSKVETPDDEMTIRFVVLMRRFLNPVDILFYMHIWEILKEHFPQAIPAEHVLQIEQTIGAINKGPFSFIVNQQSATAENIYHKVADGEYFGRNDEEAVAFLHSLLGTPAEQLALYEFYSYNWALFNVVSMLFDMVLVIEHSEQYSHLFQEEITSDKRCIYCLSDTGNFNSEEHIIPESLGNYDTVLAKGMVCDKCNNEVLSGLDEELVNSDLLALLKTFYMPYTKQGKLPQATYPNLTIKKTRPNHLVINTASKKNFMVSEPDENGFVHFSIKASGRKIFDPIIIGRALYKIGLGMIAFHEGKQSACNSKYDRTRAFIRGEKDFPNNLLISENIKPHSQITSRVDFRMGGTCIQINIYGLVFVFNLEETPVIEVTEEQLKVNGFTSYPLYAS